jgi:hypothetical protein
MNGLPVMTFNASSRAGLNTISGGTMPCAAWARMVAATSRMTRSVSPIRAI